MMYSVSNGNLFFDEDVFHELDDVNIVTERGEVIYGEIFKLNTDSMEFMTVTDEIRNIPYRAIFAIVR